MSQIVIVGGGFAGLWAAQAAAHEVIENEADIQISVISKDPYLNIRPRLYEQDPKALRTPLALSLDPLDVRLVEGAVMPVDVAQQTIAVMQAEGRSTTQRYARLVLATGSKLKAVPISGLAEHGWNIDTYDAASALDQHLHSMLQAPDVPGHHTFDIIGVGFTGIELATEMRDRIAAHSDPSTAERARIILVERATVLGPHLGSNPRPAVEAALRAANVEVKLGRSVEAMTADAVTFSNGAKIDTKTVITTTGLQADSPDGALRFERDEFGRMATDEYLRVKGMSALFAAGDVARAHVDDEHLALISCQHAMEMGQFAGHNAAGDLLGLPLRPYRQRVYLTCLHLGRSGALFTSGWDRQMQLSGDDAKELKPQINTQCICPPVGTREESLAAAHIDAQPGGSQAPPTGLVA